MEPAYTDLLICVHFRNSDHRGRQYPAARSIGFYWEGQMVCVLVLFRTGRTGSEQCCIPSQSSHYHFISVSQEERSVVGSVDMSRSLVFSASHRPLVGCPIPLAPIYPNLMRWSPLTKRSRDAWKEAEGTSKEAAQKAYVEKLLEVRFISNVCYPITGSSRPCVSQHNFCSRAPYIRESRAGLFGGVFVEWTQVEERGHYTEPFHRF